MRWSLWSRGRAIVSHASALAVHDLGIANPAEIHLTVPPAFRQENNAVVLHRGELADQDIEQHEGFRVTIPLRAVVETAASGADQDVIGSAFHRPSQPGSSQPPTPPTRGPEAGSAG